MTCTPTGIPFACRISQKCGLRVAKVERIRAAGARTMIHKRRKTEHEKVEREVLVNEAVLGSASMKLEEIFLLEVIGFV